MDSGPKPWNRRFIGETDLVEHHVRIEPLIGCLFISRRRRLLVQPLPHFHQAIPEWVDRRPHTKIAMYTRHEFQRCLDQTPIVADIIKIRGSKDRDQDLLDVAAGIRKHRRDFVQQRRPMVYR